MKHCDWFAQHKIGKNKDKDWRAELNRGSIGQWNQPVRHVDGNGGNRAKDSSQGYVETVTRRAEKRQTIVERSGEVEDNLKDRSREKIRIRMTNRKLLQSNLMPRISSACSPVSILTIREASE